MSGNIKITCQRPDGTIAVLTGRKFQAMVKAVYGSHAWLCAPEIGENSIGHVIDWKTGKIIAEVVGCSGATAAKISSTCITRSTCLMLARIGEMEAKKHAEAKE